MLLLAAGAGAYVLLSGGDVSDPNVEFRAEPTETPTPAPAKKGADTFTWPLYGYSQTRRHWLQAPKTLGPPFRQRWSWSAHSLLEFTPAIAEGKLFVIKNNGALFALDKRTGKRRWAKNLGKLAASSPAYAGGRIYATILVRDGSTERAGGRAAGEGRQEAVDASRCRAAPSPPRCSSAGASTSAPRTGRSTRWTPRTAA